MSLPSWRIICLPREVEPNHSRGRYVESISLKEGELIHPVTFLLSRKAGNLRTHVQIHFLREKEAFCNKADILSSFNKMSILFLETHIREVKTGKLLTGSLLFSKARKQDKIIPVHTGPLQLKIYMVFLEAFKEWHQAALL